ncbi:unnamed protein product [Haemonchus placei]|uniref:Ras-GEF domain-containing protein n=1 Tax=Haemonchus placei TaxID=6290 RepID=A0A0N4X808_HAEPC|nr:unnamed protein product [Haemonchus placei]
MVCEVKMSLTIWFNSLNQTKAIGSTRDNTSQVVSAVERKCNSTSTVSNAEIFLRVFSCAKNILNGLHVLCQALFIGQHHPKIDLLQSWRRIVVITFEGIDAPSR